MSANAGDMGSTPAPGKSHMPKITAVTAAMKLKDAWSLEGKL